MHRCRSPSDSNADPDTLFPFNFPASICFSASLPLPLAIQTGSSCRLSTQHTYSQFSSIAWAARHPGPARGKHTSWLGLLCSSMNRYWLEQGIHSCSHLYVKQQSLAWDTENVTKSLETDLSDSTLNPLLLPSRRKAHTGWAVTDEWDQEEITTSVCTTITSSIQVFWFSAKHCFGDFWFLDRYCRSRVCWRLCMAWHSSAELH